jgi:predicted phosphodiesterase
MGSVDKYLDPTEGKSASEAVVTDKPTPPKGFEPGVRFAGRSGTITTRPQENPNPNWDDMLKEWGFDPDLYRVVGSVEVATWDGYGKVQEEDGTSHLETRQLWSYRAKIEAINSVLEDTADYESLVEGVRKSRKKIRKESSARLETEDSALVVALADWQMGKSDGYGVEGTIHQIENMIEQVPERIKALRKSGRRIGSLYAIGLGDIGEGCGGHYDQQTFTVKLDRREQNKVSRRLIRDALMYWTGTGLVDQIVVSAVGGNHGENRNGNYGGAKSFTTFNDNDDVALFESVAEILGANPSVYGHVSFALPTDRLSMALDICGQHVAFTHGHAVKARSGEPTKLMWDWWQAQAFGKDNPAANADILLAGHYHHLAVKEQKNRTLFIAPTVDGGSVWFEQTSGMASKPGTLTFVCSPDGWSDLHIISSKKVS